MRRYASGRVRVFSYWAVFFQSWGLREMETAAGLYRLKCDEGVSKAMVALGYRQGQCVVERVPPPSAAAGK